MTLLTLLTTLYFQIDSNNVKALCQQYGAVHSAYPNMQAGTMLICYKSKDDAAKAHKALDSLLIGNTTLSVELVGESDVQRLMEVMGGAAAGAGGRGPGSIAGAGSLSSLWSQQADDLPAAGKHGGGGAGGSQWNGGGSSMWSTGGSSNSLWANPALDDHNSLLPGNLLGGQ